ncbi:hypothetical protein [Actinacidiphila glaucinigra]|uniref:baeRF2 domain-containing protein n=1 Tax=Actinacidiphila glaucinigra TaxID=235986 RepID=UPI002E34FFD2|nr:hypothetical protein [Actinacidiphila glaucinigra]
MKLSFLQPLFTRPGPWASAYLDTSRDIEDPDRVIARRWRHLRDDLTAHGADPATVHALHAAVGTDDDLPGRHGQALFATRGELVLAEELPEPPPRDTAGLEALPDALPLVVQRAPDVPYLELLVGRTEDGEGIRVAARTGRWPAGRPDPDPAVRQTVPVQEWPLTAPQLAGDLSDLADRGAAEVLVLGRDPGDPRTAEMLVDHMPEHLRSDLVTVGTARPAGTSGPAPSEELLARALGGRLNAADRARLEAYRVQRARDRTACEGTAAVVAALRGARAAAVLVNDPPPPPGHLWTGPEEPAGAALLRAAASSGADLVVVPRGTLALDDGVGVLLHRRDPVT